MVQKAHALRLSGLALCDRDGLYGVVRGATKHKELTRGGSRLRYGIGAELELEGFPGEDSLRLALFARSRRGYENLCEILTLGHKEQEKGKCVCDPSWLSERAEGVSGVLIPPRDVRELSLNPKGVEKLLAVLRSTLQSELSLAIYRHHDGFDRSRESFIVQLSRDFLVPIAASARPFYHSAERKPLTDILHCIRRGLTLESARSELLCNHEARLRSEEEMLRLFQDHPGWVHRSGAIFDSFQFELSELHYSFPCELPLGKSADEQLRELTWEGMQRRFEGEVSRSLRTQVEMELKLIAKLEVAPYFLSIREIVEMARRRKILCQGRGSAANSAVCYALGITAVDPSQSNLLFERFLSAERKEPPDIDIDFEHERREEVIQEIYECYGRDRAAMVSEIISYRRKSALRDVGKVFGLSLDQLDRLAETHAAAEDDGSEERLRAAGFDLKDPGLMQILTLAEQLRGFPRHLSIHVGGFVLSSRPLTEVTPIEPARMPGRTVIPWDKDDIDELGFFKVDVLGLGMLTALRKCLELVAAEQRMVQGTQTFDPLEALARIPREDEATYDSICRADTIGVFQIESRAQMSMLPRLRPRKFYDLVIEVALVRPGPIQGGMVHPYLKRRNEKEEVTYPHPDLEPVLKRTLGVPLFQEQVMQLAILGAGYTGGQADQLRRDMASWKKHGRLLEHRDRLLEGFRKHGISGEFARSLFEQIKGFGEYGFPESHASSFALLVYASSWLKTHYPAHFACALLNSQPLGFYAPTTLIRDAQKHGVAVLDVCVLKSGWDSSLVQPNGALRLGLRLVRSFSRESAERLIEARDQGFTSSFDELIQRSKLKQGEVEALAQAGAFETLEPGRRNALFRARSPKTNGLFRFIASEEPRVELPALRASEQLVLDYEHKGLSVSDHPLRYFRRRLKRLDGRTAADLAYLNRGAKVSVAGLVLNRQRPGTASGVVFMTLEDETGFLNLILWTRVFERYERVARQSELLFVEGVIERDTPHAESQTSVIHVVATHVEDLRARVARAQSERPPGRVESKVLRRLSRNFH